MADIRGIHICTATTGNVTGGTSSRMYKALVGAKLLGFNCARIPLFMDAVAGTTPTSTPNWTTIDAAIAMVKDVGFPFLFITIGAGAGEGYVTPAGAWGNPKTDSIAREDNKALHRLTFERIVRNWGATSTIFIQFGNEMAGASFEGNAFSSAKTPSAMTNASPPQITCTAHGLTVGDRIVHYGFTSSGANGEWVVRQVIDANNYTTEDEAGTAAPAPGGTNVTGAQLMKQPTVFPWQQDLFGTNAIWVRATYPNITLVYSQFQAFPSTPNGADINDVVLDPASYPFQSILDVYGYSLYVNAISRAYGNGGDFRRAYSLAKRKGAQYQSRFDALGVFDKTLCSIEVGASFRDAGMAPTGGGTTDPMIYCRSQERLGDFRAGMYCAEEQNNQTPLPHGRNGFVCYFSAVNLQASWDTASNLFHYGLSSFANGKLYESAKQIAYANGFSIPQGYSYETSPTD